MKNKTEPGHSGRKHAKFSASSMERIFACPGSVKLSEGLPDKESEASKLGTYAHECLEQMVRGEKLPYLNAEMGQHLESACDFITDLNLEVNNSLFLIEEKTSLAFIHQDMWGTLDYAVVEHFGTLHILDFKYGSHSVSPVENLQLITYALGVGFKYDWNFSRVRLWIIQPRARGYQGPNFWEMSIQELKSYVPKFRKAIERVESGVKEYKEGSWCWFCRAKSKCPLKQDARTGKAKEAFRAELIGN